MPISTTYNFQALANDDLILDCFERIGISGEQLVPVQMNSANRSLNFLLLDWISKNINLWTLNSAFLTLNTGQSLYNLSPNITDIIQITSRVFSRQALINPILATVFQTNTGQTYDNGGGGVAAQAFDFNPATACTQNVADGNISFNFGVINGVNTTQTINRIGIQSNANTNYTLVVEYSNDNANWIQLLAIPAQVFNVGQVVWFDIPVPVIAWTYRVRETGGQVLNIQEIYYNNSIGIAQSNTGQTYDGAGGGNANYGYDNNDTTACIQAGADGNISYNCGTLSIGGVTQNITQNITFIGIQSNATTLYTLVVEYSNDNVNWSLLQTILPQTFTIGQIVWFDIIAPVTAWTYRIRETGGQTLNIQEIYFTNKTIDLQITPVSRNTYLSLSQKFIQGRPSCYYFNKQLIPTLNIWPTPTSDYQVLQYSYVNVMTDAGPFNYTTAVPPRMFPALAWGLTWQLALKYKPELAANMKAEYDQAFATATANDSENVDISLGVDIGAYYES
jgi:hypothetical protein